MASPELIVVKRWTWKQFILLISVIVISLILFFVSGYLLGNTDGFDLREENNQLTNSIEQLTAELEESGHQLVKLEQISKVDQAAKIHAGNSMDTQQQEIRELERELKFYRSIMAPGESVKGLQISQFNWHKQEQDVISWQVSLIQSGSQGKTISGYVRIELIAKRGNEQIILPLKTEKQSEKINYRFRYFQHLTGSIPIPENITPVSVKIVAYQTQKGLPIIEKQFPWQSDEEKMANVE